MGETASKALARGSSSKQPASNLPSKKMSTPKAPKQKIAERKTQDPPRPRPPLPFSNEKERLKQYYWRRDEALKAIEKFFPRDIAHLLLTFLPHGNKRWEEFTIYDLSITVMVFGFPKSGKATLCSTFCQSQMEKTRPLLEYFHVFLDIHDVTSQMASSFVFCFFRTRPFAKKRKKKNTQRTAEFKSDPRPRRTGYNRSKVLKFFCLRLRMPMECIYQRRTQIPLPHGP